METPECEFCLTRILNRRIAPGCVFCMTLWRDVEPGGECADCDSNARCACRQEVLQRPAPSGRKGFSTVRNLPPT